MTHENACIIYTEVYMASSVYSRLLMRVVRHQLFAGKRYKYPCIVEKVVSMGLGNQCRAGNFKNRSTGVSFFRFATKFCREKHDHRQ